MERCVRSLFEQTLDSLEYIFVDDCSPDDSIGVILRVLKEYPQRETQVKIIRHEINKGVGQSRQNGINAASGEYIIHCDPDDWVELDMYECLYLKTKETSADIVICDFTDVFNDYSKVQPQRPLELTSGSVLRSISGASFHRLHGSLWNKMIASYCYTNVTIPDKVDCCEDMLVLFQILNVDRKIEYIAHPFYHYNRANEASITTTSHRKNLEGDCNFMKTITSLPSVDQDSVNAIGEFMLWQAFEYADCPDSEFRRIYGKWGKYIGWRKGIRMTYRILMRMACRGHYKNAKRIFDILHQIKIRLNKVFLR